MDKKEEEETLGKDDGNTFGKVVIGGLAGAGVAAGITGIASAILFKKTFPRPNGVDESIVAEFADTEKMAEYAKKMEYIGVWAEGVSKEDIFITARDGIKLHAVYIPAEKPSKKLVILHHGYTSKAMDNSTHAYFFHREGYEVLLLDLRAHGESEGEYVGFGILDRFDTEKWIEYAHERFGGDIKIVLHGTSMGGTTVLMALGLESVQNSVSAVIADCAFTSPAEIFSHVMKKNYHIPITSPIINLNGMYSKNVVGYRFDEYSTQEALKDNKVPVLFVHGKKDKFVPTIMSEQNYEACTSRKQLLMVENAGHGSSIFENTELYEETEKEFLKDL